jgi:LacI family transcriptional regulator
MATIADVAKRAGVSVATVSHVMNRTRHVDPETARRVEEAIGALRYSPNSLARGLRQGVTKTIGLLIPDNSNPFFAAVAREIEDAGFKAGYTVILCNSGGSATKEERYLSVLLSKQIDGMIISASSDETSLASRIAAMKVPTVLLDREIPLPYASSVLVNNAQGGHLAGRYLLELGHRKLGVIAGPRDSNSSPARLIGFERALREQGLDLDPSALAISDYQFAGGARSMERLLELAPDITAVFACNDLMAMGALAALRGKGLAAPGDFSIIGFDNIPYAVATAPPLTTIAQPIDKIGRHAVALLLERLETPLETTKREILAPILIERETCAAPRG